MVTISGGAPGLGGHPASTLLVLVILVLVVGLIVWKTSS